METDLSLPEISGFFIYILSDKFHFLVSTLPFPLLTLFFLNISAFYLIDLMSGEFRLSFIVLTVKSS